MPTYAELGNIRGPFRISPKEKKEETISTVDEYQEAFISALEAYDVRQKKPVRWNFLTDNEGMFQVSRAISPMMKMNERTTYELDGFERVEILVFFFRAEDGIRDRLVTGVQTCALPISYDFLLVKIGVFEVVVVILKRYFQYS